MFPPLWVICNLRLDISVTAGFVYAVYENEESVHKILHTCSTKTDRTLDDGRCEYYLEVYSQRSSARRKSVRPDLSTRAANDAFAFHSLDSNHSLVCGEYFDSKTMVNRTRGVALCRKIPSGLQRATTTRTDTATGNND